MSSTTSSSIMYRIDLINNIHVPQEHSERATMWKMAHRGEIVESSNVLRAIAICDIKESPYIIPDLYKSYAHRLPNKDYTDEITYIIASMSLQEIADFFGY